MPTVSTQIRIDSTLKKEAIELFKDLGLDMSSAINMFLRQCVLHDGIPFSIERPPYKQEVIDAMEEAMIISRDPNTKRYSSFVEALEDIDL